MTIASLAKYEYLYKIVVFLAFLFRIKLIGKMTYIAADSGAREIYGE